MGIRTAIKEDLKATAAELLYGTGIRLAAEFFLPTTGKTTTNFLKEIKEHFSETKPQAIARHGTRSLYISRASVNSVSIFAQRYGKRPAPTAIQRPVQSDRAWRKTFQNTNK
jgi:hypothetical protein